ncbi:1859_t:CDS:2, partial [Dentiscutata heterogama]
IEDYEEENYIASYRSFFYVVSNSNSTLSNDAKFWLIKHLEFGYDTSKNEKKVSNTIHNTDKDESKVRQLDISKLLSN